MKPIVSYTIDSNEKGPSALIVAGVHGDEFEPMLATLSLRNLLGGRIVKGKITVVPVAHSSAYDLGQRFGADGSDMARICPGKKDGTASEQEAWQLSALIQASDYLIDLHTGGRLFNIYPLAGYMLHQNAEILEQQRKMAIAFGLPVIWGSESSLNGRTLSVARDADVPAIYVEFGGSGPVNMQIVFSYTRGCMSVLQLLGMVNDCPYAPEKEQYFLEDNADGSGYLQGMLPSPSDGIFICDVVPGQRVQQSERLGNVIDPFSAQSEEVLADKSGIMLFTRSDPRVKKGDSLGGILSV